MITGMAISAGYYHNLLIGCTNRFVTGWGDNRSNQLVIPFLTGVKKISAGGAHSIAILQNDTLTGWGGPSTSLPTNGAENCPTGRYLEISTGPQWSMALISGTRRITGWGLLANNRAQFTGANLVGVTQIAAGYSHSLAVRSDGQLTGWGGVGLGETTIPVGFLNPISIAAGDGFSLAVTPQGSLTGWGQNSSNQRIGPTGFTGVRKVVAGRNFGLALSSGGMVTGWGNNENGQITIPAIVRSGGVLDIGAGFGHSIALLSSGRVIGWGLNTDASITSTVLNQATNYTPTCDFTGPNLAIKYGTGGCYIGGVNYGIPCSGLRLHFESNYGLVTGTGNSITKWIDRVYGFEAEPFDFANNNKPTLINTQNYYQNVTKSGVYLDGNTFFQVGFSGKNLIPSNSGRTYVVIGRLVDPFNRAQESLIGDPSFNDSQVIFKNSVDDIISYFSYPEDFSLTWQINNNRNVETGYFTAIAYHPPTGFGTGTGFLRVNGTTKYLSTFTQPAPRLTGLTIGARDAQSASETANAEIISVLVYDRELSSLEMFGIESIYSKSISSQTGSCCYKVEFNTYDYPSRFVVITGDALLWNGSAGFPDYRNLGCNCVTGKGSEILCPELDNLRDGLVKVFDTSCVLTNGNTITGNLFIENNIPVKYLLIPDCSGTSTGSRWDLSIDKCEGQRYYCTSPQPDFSGSPLIGTVPLTVQFTDLSVSFDNSKYYWGWDFNNDGTWDSVIGEQNPTYTYNETGIYSVKLLVYDNSGEAEIVKTNYITVLPVEEPPPPPVDQGCSQFYDITFWAYNYPSRLVIITGGALVWNGAAGLPDYTKLGCDCVTGNKNCPELDNLDHGLVKVLDTYCVLRDTIPFSGTVYLPNSVPHKMIVIPDCQNINQTRTGATWKLEIKSGTCIEKSCLCTTEQVPVCNFNFNITFTPSISGNISDFNLLTSYDQSSRNKLNVGIQKGSNAFYKDIAFVVKNLDYKNTSIPGVKWVTNSYIGNSTFLFTNNTNLKVIQNEEYTADITSSWLQDSGDFGNYNLSYPTGIAGTILQISPDQNSRASALRYGNNDIDIYTLEYNAEDIPSNIFYKKEILIKDLGKRNSGVPIYYSFNSGWASYNCTTGTNYKNLFSWAVQVVDKATLKNGILIESGAKFITGVEDVINKYIKEGMPPMLYTGARGAFGDIKAFCANDINCPPPGPPGEALECWTGNNIYDQEYKNWFSGVLEKYKSQTGVTGSGGAIVPFTVEEITINRTWQVLTGFIQYNNVVSGDTFKFRLYPFDYTGLYRQLHLGNDPLYPSYDFDLVYPKDWTTLSGLVTKLNQKLAPPFSWPVWYPYYCLSGTPTGIYITGSLARFWENTGSCCYPSGDLTVFDYKNRIDFEALRSFPILPSKADVGNGDVGVSGQENWFYDVSVELYTGNRRSFQIYSGYSYLIPNEIELQRLVSGKWETLDKKVNLYNEITGLDVTCIQTDFEIFGQDRVINLDWLENITGQQNPADILFEQPENTGRYKTLYQFNKQTISSPEDYCPITVNNMPVSMIWPEGFPSIKINQTGGLEFVDNRYWCSPKDIPKESGTLCTPCTSGDATGCVSPNLLKFDDRGCCECVPAFSDDAVLCQYRTGWNLTGELGEKALFSGNADGYRIILKNLSGQFFEGYKPLDYFYIGNINLYGLEDYSLPVMEHGPECLIGANFNIDIGGYVGKTLTGQYPYTITKDMKGEFRIQGLVITEYIPLQNRQIKFNKASGYVVGDYYTGTYGKQLKPSGWACHTFDGYYFYNRFTNEIAFEKTACEYTKVVTGIRRTYEIIKPSVVNKELLVGGRFSKIIDYISVTGSGNFVGQINNVVYKEYDVLGYYPLTGIVSGTTSGGRLNINQNRTGYAYTINSIYPYYPSPTGAIRATGYIKILTGNINNFDYISINNNTIIYNTDNSLYTSPGYFNNINTLNTIINESTGVFLVSGLVTGNNTIVLYSLLLGSDGNNITLTTSNTGGIQINNNNLENGYYIYPKIYKYFYTTGTNNTVTGIELTPIFTGNILSSIVATGFYTSISGSGSITGNVPTYIGTRTFTGIWGLQTGQDNDYENFLGKNWLSGINRYFNRTKFQDVFNLLQISVRYDNDLSITDDIGDVAQLRIKDFNYNLVYPTGNLINNTGEIIFRISGIKNL